MIYLLLSILSSTFIVITLKLFERFKVNNQQGIVLNYLIAALFGLILGWDAFDTKRIFGGDETWVWFALILGILFIILFNVMSMAAQKVSITTTAISNNMSMVIPVVAAVILYGDSMPWLKVVGIILALIGVYLTTKTHKAQQFDRKYLWLPIVLFFGSGTVGTLINYTKEHFLPDEQAGIFVPAIFAVAGIIGFFAVIPYTIKNKVRLTWNTIIGGTILGMLNYGSILFLIKALDMDALQDSEIFPINNMGIVGAASLIAFVFFRERLSKMNWAGIFISVIAIAIITFHAKIIPG